MTAAEVKKALRAARKEWKDECWGHDDDLAVEAFIIMLKRHLKEPQVAGSVDHQPQRADTIVRKGPGLAP